MDQTATDRDLMIRFVRRGDVRAYESLVRRWDRRVLSFLTKASGDPEAAQDMRQEVFLRLYKYGGTYNPERTFTTWLFQIASNVLSTWRAKRARASFRILDRKNDAAIFSASDPAPGPRENALSNELADRIDRALAQFTPDERKLLLLRLDLELSYPQIGEILETPETTVKSRFYTLLKRLQQQLSSTGITESSERSCTS